MKIITIARKPLSESNVASNVLKHGCGGIHIDGCKVGDEKRLNAQKGGESLNVLVRPHGNDSKESKAMGAYGVGAHQVTTGYKKVEGRWPSNLLIFDSSEAETSFPSTSPSKSGDRGAGLRGHGRYGQSDQTYNNHSTVSDSGGSAARFFKQFKVGE